MPLNSQYFTLRLNECTCNLPHILFTCPHLSDKHLILLNSSNFFNIPFDLLSILNINYEPAINIVKIFILETDFVR